MSAQAAELRELSTRVRKLVPGHRNPERYHEEKDEIAGRLSDLANEMERSK